MGELVDLGQMRRLQAAHRAFALWPRRLGYEPQPEASLCDLPDIVLGDLAELTPTATLALYDLVLGVRGLGPGERFTFLESTEKVKALDTFLFLADAVRFELMRRLGWLADTPGERHDLIALSLNSGEIKCQPGGILPRLTRGYPGYAAVERKLKVEPAAVVHSLIPQALETFRERLTAD